jgi:putative SOS response-associated peptidase YedK
MIRIHWMLQEANRFRFWERNRVQPFRCLVFISTFFEPQRKQIGTTHTLDTARAVQIITLLCAGLLWESVISESEHPHEQEC